MAGGEGRVCTGCSFHGGPSSGRSRSGRPLCPHVMSGKAVSFGHVMGRVTRTSDFAPTSVRKIRLTVRGGVSRCLIDNCRIRLNSLKCFSTGLGTHPMVSTGRVRTRSVCFSGMGFHPSSSFQGGIHKFMRGTGSKFTRSTRVPIRRHHHELREFLSRHPVVQHGRCARLAKLLGGGTLGRLGN